ncbi:MAG: HAMP domain-containing histidine kinase [Acidimicrobiia bacterium]|nr:HAMP domain-containing histidine kinase [Acidimicrobiia bacterium]
MNDAGVMADADRIRRLERRLARERAARRAAEHIAESRTRALYEANRDLDRRISERTAELDRALATVTKAGEARSAFLAAISHQLRTPLNGLMGMLELVDVDALDQPTAECLAVAFRSAGRLDRLVSRLITYSDLEGADLSSSPMHRSATNIVSALHDRWLADCLHAGQLLSVEDVADAVTVAHPALDLALDEVMANVVDHAGPGAVRIRARLIDGRQDNAECGQLLRIEVLDPGEGLPADLDVAPGELRLDGDSTTTGDRPAHLGLALIGVAVRALGGRWRPVTDCGDSGVAIDVPIDRSIRSN